MEVLLGGLAGLITGVLGSVVAGVFQTLGRALRDRRRARRSEPPVREPRFTPYWVLFGMLGLIAGGSWTWRLQGTWVTGAVAGLGVPALATAIFVIWAIRQLRQ